MSYVNVLKVEPVNTLEKLRKIEERVGGKGKRKIKVKVKKTETVPAPITISKTEEIKFTLPTIDQNASPSVNIPKIGESLYQILNPINIEPESVVEYGVAIYGPDLELFNKANTPGGSTLSSNWGNSSHERILKAVHTYEKNQNTSVDNLILQEGVHSIHFYKINALNPSFIVVKNPLANKSNDNVKTVLTAYQFLLGDNIELLFRTPKILTELTDDQKIQMHKNDFEKELKTAANNITGKLPSDKVIHELSELILGLSQFTLEQIKNVKNSALGISLEVADQEVIGSLPEKPATTPSVTEAMKQEIIKMSILVGDDKNVKERIEQGVVLPSIPPDGSLRKEMLIEMGKLGTPKTPNPEENIKDAVNKLDSLFTDDEKSKGSESDEWS